MMPKLLASLAALCFSVFSVRAQHMSPSNTAGEEWKDDEGNFINAHGAGILHFGEKYYLFGEIKKGETHLVPGQDWEDYRVPAGGVACYSSKDLMKWKYEGVALSTTTTDPDSDLDTGRVIERPKVIYNEKTRKFVMWLHIDKPDYSYARAGLAISDSPEGPYHYLGSLRPNGEECRDMTLFKDNDDKAYLIYASEKNNTMHICLLSDDYLSPTKYYNRILIDQRREAPALFKYGCKYFLITSLCSGWSPNAAIYSVADSLMGNWENRGNPCSGPGADTSYGSQSTYVLPINASTGSFLFMADQWNKTNLSDSRYLWLPFKMSKEEVKIQLEEFKTAGHYWMNSGRVTFSEPLVNRWKPGAVLDAASMISQQVDVSPYSVLQFELTVRSTDSTEKGSSFIRFYDSAANKLLTYKSGFTSSRVDQQTGNYTEVPPYARYAIIGIETDSSNTGKIWVDSFHLELNIGEPPVKHSSMCSQNEYMRPFWNSDTIYNETVLMVSDSGKPASGRLFFKPDGIISVKSFDLEKKYKNSIDYTIKGRSIKRSVHSQIPFISERFFDRNKDLAWFNLQSRWILVTYTHHDKWNGPVPPPKGEQLPLLMNKLKNKSPVTILGYGMSITRGMNISSYDDVTPYMPTYLDLFANQLRKIFYNPDINLVNAGLPGALVSWGAEYAEKYVNPLHPDLLIIDFGMNDFWRYTPAEFKEYIQTMINKVKKENPDTEIMLVSCMDFDPDYILDSDNNKSFYVSNMQGYKKVLSEMEMPGIVNLDMTSLSDAIYSRKKAKDCITNPLHPNDYLARWYAQAMVALLTPASYH